MSTQHRDAIPDSFGSSIPSIEPRARERKMIPREHGAYAELLFPMAAVFLGGTPTTSSWLLAIASIACFIMNEPLLVLFGQRGARTQREQGGRARRALILLMLVAIAAGIPGLWLAPPLAQYMIALPLLLGVGVMMMAIEGLERSGMGETMAAATLSSVAVPLGLASGLSMLASSAVAAIWLVASLLGTSVVRLTVARTRAKTDEELRRVRAARAMLILVCLAVIGVGAAAPLTPRGPLWILTAALPVVVVVAGIAMARPTARSLRSIGWGLVLANVCTLVAVVAALKLVQDFQAVKSTLPFPMF
ncbi:MAG: YwiC-like family protein [Myxococcales bacterium]|nr:YwiC-like family protein [Myxococcales bacterium]